jgi:hypothetical protein
MYRNINFEKLIFSRFEITKKKYIWTFLFYLFFKINKCNI